MSAVGAWMKFYPSDWLAAVTSSGMSLSEQGAYLRLLCTAWDQGGIPTDTKRLARIVGVSRQEFEEMWEVLRDKFEAHPDNPSRMVNPKQERVREEQEAQVAKRAGWRDRKQAQRDRERDTPRDNAVGLRAQDSGLRSEEPKKTRKARVEWEEVAALATPAAHPPLKAWFEYRRELGKPLTLQSWKRLASQAADTGEFSAKVEHSIAQGYTGLFAPKDRGARSRPADATADNVIRMARERGIQ